MKRALERFTDETFDLAIVGGGITGAGVALDAATRGWRVALVDKSDFASGTSSVSSKLIHGGLRYLERADFHLVAEALHERGRLLANAPHLVQPLPFVLPFYKKARVARWQWRLALTLYDLLAGHANLRRSRPLSEATVRRASPGLHATGRCGAALYYDAQMDDARLCLAVIHTAVRHGAACANYVEAVGFECDGGRISAVHARDVFTQRELRIAARVVLNAAGPWVDEVRRRAGAVSGPRLQPTKGIHLLVAPRPEPFAFLLLHPRDGRVFFVLPWYGKTLLGTTDTFPDAGPDALTVRPDEVAYLLEGYNHHFTPALHPEDVLGSFAGLRPLLAGQAGTPSSRSREYEIATDEGGLISVAGGKYTTYRQMAEEITDLVGRRLGLADHCRTRRLRLHGAPAVPWPAFVAATLSAVQSETGLSLDAAHHLMRRYGTAVFEVLPYLSAEGATRVHPDEPDLCGELAYQSAEEMALCRADHFLRRSRIGLWRPDLWATSAASRGL
jgi:glycerol-3-phosphate dehydrogenase